MNHRSRAVILLMLALALLAVPGWSQERILTMAAANTEHGTFTEPDYSREGYVDYPYSNETYRLWYGMVGDPLAPPLLVLHGGPGGNHHNLAPLQELADQYAVIFYDQLGTGLSDRPDNPELWNIDRYVDEVRCVRDALGLKSYHLAGHSWGTTLATAFAAKYPSGIQSLSLHSPVLDFPTYIREVAPALKREIPNDGGQAIDDFENGQSTNRAAFDEAFRHFLQQHVIQTWPLPPPMQRLIEQRGPQVHDTMVGSESELNMPGNLREVCVTDRLPSLSIPVLVTCGENDFCNPAWSDEQTQALSNRTFRIITDSAHMTFMDQPGQVVGIQREFLEAVAHP